MNRFEPVEVRKQQIIQAAISIVHEQGICNLRVADVAKRAGISNGLVFHHFQSREGVLDEVMRYVMRSYFQQSEKVLRGVVDPRQRIDAYLKMSFDPRQLDPEIASTWLALFYLGKTSDRFASLMRIYESRQISNIRHCTRQLFGDAEADFYATSLIAMIDGLWLKHAVRRQAPDFDMLQRDALRIASILLDQ